jgi:hypothetical protein
MCALAARRAPVLRHCSTGRPLVCRPVPTPTPTNHVCRVLTESAVLEIGSPAPAFEVWMRLVAQQQRQQQSEQQRGQPCALSHTSSTCVLLPPSSHMTTTEPFVLHLCRWHKSIPSPSAAPGSLPAHSALQLPEPLTGKTVKLSDFAGKQALLVMFICNHCPYVVHLKGEGPGPAAALVTDMCSAAGMAGASYSCSSPEGEPA